MAQNPREHNLGPVPEPRTTFFDLPIELREIIYSLVLFTDALMLYKIFQKSHSSYSRQVKDVRSIVGPIILPAPRLGGFGLQPIPHPMALTCHDMYQDINALAESRVTTWSHQTIWASVHNFDFSVLEQTLFASPASDWSPATVDITGRISTHRRRLVLTLIFDETLKTTDLAKLLTWSDFVKARLADGYDFAIEIKYRSTAASHGTNVHLHNVLMRAGAGAWFEEDSARGATIRKLHLFRLGMPWNMWTPQQHQQYWGKLYLKTVSKEACKLLSGREWEIFLQKKMQYC